MSSPQCWHSASTAVIMASHNHMLPEYSILYHNNASMNWSTVLVINTINVCFFTAEDRKQTTPELTRLTVMQPSLTLLATPVLFPACLNICETNELPSFNYVWYLSWTSLPCCPPRPQEKTRAVPLRSSSEYGHRPVPVLYQPGRQYARVASTKEFFMKNGIIWNVAEGYGSVAPVWKPQVSQHEFKVFVLTVEALTNKPVL